MTTRCSSSKSSPDPERERLLKDKQEWEQQKRNLWFGDVQKEAAETIRSGVQKELTPYLKGKKLSEQAFGMFLENVNKELQKNFRADNLYQAQMKIHVGKMDKDAALKLAKERMSKYLPLAVRNTYKLFYSNFGAKQAEQKRRVATNEARKETPAGAPPVERLAKLPDAKNIDSTRTTREMIIKGEAWLKNGKFVRF